MSTSIDSPPAKERLVRFYQLFSSFRLLLLLLASARSEWALPDLNHKRQITVGTTGPQHKTRQHSHKHTIHKTQPTTHNHKQTSHKRNHKHKPATRTTNTNTQPQAHKPQTQLPTHNHKRTTTTHTATNTTTSTTTQSQTHSHNTQPQHTEATSTSTTTNTQPQHTTTAHNHNTQTQYTTTTPTTTHKHNSQTQPQMRNTTTYNNILTCVCGIFVWQVVIGGHRVALLDANWRPWRHSDANSLTPKEQSQARGPTSKVETAKLTTHDHGYVLLTMA